MTDFYAPPSADLGVDRAGLLAEPLASPVPVWRHTARLFISELPTIVGVIVPLYAPFRLLEAYGETLGLTSPTGSTSGSLLIDALLGAIVAPALVYAFVEGERSGRSPGAWAALTYGFRRWANVVAVNFVSGLYALLGLLLLIVPGIYFYVRFALVAEIVAMEKADSWEIVKRRSVELTTGRMWLLLGIFLPIVLLYAALAFGMGYLLSIYDHWLVSAATSLVADVAAAWFVAAATVTYVFARFGASHAGSRSWTEAMRWVEDGASEPVRGATEV